MRTLKFAEWAATRLTSWPCIHSTSTDRGTVVACRYCPPPSLARPETLATPKTKFYDAIARVVLTQPHLQVGITGENSRNPAFVRLRSLDLRNHVDWTSLHDSSLLESLYLESFQIQLDSRYDHLSTRPGWRVVIIYKPRAESMEVLYVWNHPHHDGMSGKIFHQSLLRNLNETFIQDKEPMLNVPEGTTNTVSIRKNNVSSFIWTEAQILEREDYV